MGIRDRVCGYALNGAKGFVQGFWQLLVILSVMNLIDRFWVDGYWVVHTNAWEIPGTEDLKPYITAKGKGKKWLFGTVGMAVISAALAAIMMLFMAVLAPLDLRIERAVASGFEESDVRRRIAQQITDADRIEAADVVFNNDGTPDELRNQVLLWWQEYQKKD